MSDELGFTRQEVMSYLPTGWALADAVDSGTWSADERKWRAVVLDLADQEWQLEVDAREAGEAGRLEALRRSVDRLYRSALGKRRR